MPTIENLYFIAVIPSEKISAEITAFKQDIANRFESRASLKVLSHITLKAPFKLHGEEHEGLLKWFRELPVSREAFTLKLKGFGSFPNKNSPVIFVHPEPNPVFHSLQKEIIASFKKAFPSIIMMAPDWKFNPHMTIAYKDLSPEFFPEAWSEYQSKLYEENMQVNSFFLLQHDRRKWNIIEEFVLNT